PEAVVEGEVGVDAPAEGGGVELLRPVGVGDREHDDLELQLDRARGSAVRRRLAGGLGVAHIDLPGRWRERRQQYAVVTAGASAATPSARARSGLPRGGR